MLTSSIYRLGTRKNFRSLYLTTRLFSRHRNKDITPSSPADRLKNLKSAERTVAVFAGVSLLLGYFALKRAFSDMASKKEDLPRPIVLAGPSGSGKSTLLRMLLQEFPDEFGFSVSHTSRKPRPGEKTGKEYHFCTREEFQKKIDKGEFIEWAEYSSNLYGTSVKAVADVQLQGKVCILDIDMQGVRSIKQTELSPVYIFIKPPSIDVLKERLSKRNTETEENLQKRLQAATEEINFAGQPEVFDHTIVNDTVERAYDQLKEVMTKQVKAKTIPES